MDPSFYAGRRVTPTSAKATDSRKKTSSGKEKSSKEQKESAKGGFPLREENRLAAAKDRDRQKREKKKGSQKKKAGGKTERDGGGGTVAKGRSFPEEGRKGGDSIQSLLTTRVDI